MTAEEVVVSLVKLNGGKVIGRTRLQKEAYLLDRCGGDFGLRFTYYYYGPYSFELVRGWKEAECTKRIKIAEDFGKYDVPYSIFSAEDLGDEPDSLGSLPAASAREYLGRMAHASDIGLELAATMVYLNQEEGYGKQTIKEVKIRKTLKATDRFLQEAIDLLGELGLGVPTGDDSAWSANANAQG